MKFTFDPVLLTAFALALVRAAAWLFVSPPFNTRMIPTSVKAGIAAALALAATPHLVGPDIPLDTGAVHRRARHARRWSASRSACSR